MVDLRGNRNFAEYSSFVGLEGFGPLYSTDDGPTEQLVLHFTDPYRSPVLPDLPPLVPLDSRALLSEDGP